MWTPLMVAVELNVLINILMHVLNIFFQARVDALLLWEELVEKFLSSSNL